MDEIDKFAEYVDYINKIPISSSPESKLEALRSSVILEPLDSTFTFKTNNLWELMKALEEVDPEFSMPCKLSPDTLKLVEQDVIEVSGSFIYPQQSSLFNGETKENMLGNGEYVTNHIIVYGQNNPATEYFLRGKEEGMLLIQNNQAIQIEALWSDSEFKDVATPHGFGKYLYNLGDEENITTIVANLAGLYASFLRYNPEEAVAEISKEADSPELRHAVKLIGYTGDYSIVKIPIERLYPSDD